jgi:hypothetical protein
MLDDAGEIPSWIGRQLRRWGRIGVTQTKWKYETVRVYCSFGWYQLHSITHPGYMYSRYPKWLWSLDCRWGSRLIDATRVNRLVVAYQQRLYRGVYEAALRRWPKHAYAILMGADHTELLLGLDPRLKREPRTSPAGYSYFQISWEDPNADSDTDIPAT